MSTLRSLRLFRRKGFPLAAILLASISFPGLAAAQSPADTSASGTFGAPIGSPDETWSYTLGLGAAVVPDYEGSEDYRAAPVPIFRAQKGHQYGALFGARASSNLIPHPNWRAGPIAEFIRKRSDVHNSKVDDMRTVDAALMLGAQVGYEHTVGSSVLGANVSWRHDVTGSNDGWILQPGVNYRSQLGNRLRLNASVDMSYASDDYMETYFSVGQREAAKTGFKRYSADAGFKDVGASVTLTYNFTENWALGGIVGYKRLMNDAADSPVVDDVGNENQFLGGVFFTYSWRTGG